jgi:hypothetical protein
MHDVTKINNSNLCFVDLASSYNLTNNPTSCTILLKYIYLFLFCTCFGHPSAHHQEKITVSIRHWYLSLCMGGDWSAGWINPSVATGRLVGLIQPWRLVSRPDATHTEWQIPVSHRYSNFLLMMGTWMPETCTEEK